MEEDKRREAAIASSPSLQPNFKSESVTEDQISKFQELHRRRLQIKSRSKGQKKSKDGIGKSDTKGLRDGNSSIPSNDSSISISKSNIVSDNSVLQQDNLAIDLVSKKRQKLHWGLDTKERWERKANM
ncbi:uncharacterized protein LOC131144961 isoform X2 [Malania oleifera]|uniref:uncharacterized protein LOC131144961 isoform X2 n=1 Tax=Malania oleifera TaxID=397392 RepID=UPI0025ADC3E6|nr:uncharacterized protein LOC131144961 isoform X2 [Malania oleifera]